MKKIYQAAQSFIDAIFVDKVVLQADQQLFSAKSKIDLLVRSN
jgi:hypothetical protein